MSHHAQDYGIDVLAFGPHPDDVEIFCGGTLIRLSDLGHSTGVVDLTRGELASRGTVEERARESERAAAILGLRFRENLGLPDGFLHGLSGAESPEEASALQLGRVVEVLRRHRPEIVLLPWIEERHPDHAAAGVLLTRAVFYAGLRKFETSPVRDRFAPRQVLYYELRHRMVPTFVLDTSAAAARKREAMACYGSQVGPAKATDVPTLIGSPDALDAIEARDRYRGTQIGTSHGEALRMANVPGLVDPVAHFRSNPFTGAHAFEPLR